METKIRVIIADDHLVVRDGIRSILASHPRIRVVAEAQDGKELVAMCTRLKPDVALTDVVMNGGMDGEAAALELRQQAPLVKVVAMSMYEKPYDIFRMMNAGAIGYISKNAERDEYINAIESAFSYKYFYCKRIRRRVQEAGASLKRLYNKIEFSDKELPVLELICKGRSNKEIADKLECSIRTVEGYRLKLLEKFETNSMIKVVSYAISTGVVKIEHLEY